MISIFQIVNHFKKKKNPFHERNNKITFQKAQQRKMAYDK